MSFLIDTCVISELVKKEPHKDVLRWFEECDEERLFVSVLTIAELKKGVMKLATGKHKAKLESWLQEVLKQFEDRTLPVDQTVALQWAVFAAEAEKIGRPLPVVDSLIAATASVHNFTVVTRNNPDMEATGVRLMNLWD